MRFEAINSSYVKRMNIRVTNINRLGQINRKNRRSADGIITEIHAYILQRDVYSSTDFQAGIA